MRDFTQKKYLTNQLWGVFLVFGKITNVLERKYKIELYSDAKYAPKGETAMKACLRIRLDLILTDAVVKGEWNMWLGRSNFEPRYTRGTRYPSKLSPGSIGIFLVS